MKEFFIPIATPFNGVDAAPPRYIGRPSDRGSSKHPDESRRRPREWSRSSGDWRVGKDRVLGEKGN
jgi:hypothetical protein